MRLRLLPKQLRRNSVAPKLSADLQSMTGFARATGSGDGRQWTWELRSVNGKGLDVRFRGPPGLEQLEQPVREQVGARFQRGSIQLGLVIQRVGQSSSVRVDRDALSRLVEIASEYSGAGGQPLSVEQLMAIRGVVEIVDDDSEASDDLRPAIVATLETALDALASMRRGEGAAVAAYLSERIDRIETLTEEARSNPARSVEAIRKRLAEQVAVLLDASPQLDPDRLHQEAVLLATRADIAEEIDRLTAHVAAARALLASGGPVGRRLDFLAQEFNREANTLCSKSNDRSLTATGLDLKATVDQFREQVQNLE